LGSAGLGEVGAKGQLSVVSWEASSGVAGVRDTRDAAAKQTVGFRVLGIIIIVFMIIIVRIADDFNSGNGLPTTSNGFTLSR
jgi:hypothetical protein